MSETNHDISTIINESSIDFENITKAEAIASLKRLQDKFGKLLSNETLSDNNHTVSDVGLGIELCMPIVQEELEHMKVFMDCKHCSKTYGTLGCCDFVSNEPVYSCKEGHKEYEYRKTLEKECGLGDSYAKWDWRVRYCDIIEYDKDTGYMLVSVPDTSRSDPSCKIYSIAKSDANVVPKSAIHEYTDFDHIECVESDINVDKNEALNVFHKFLKSHTEVDS